MLVPELLLASKFAIWLGAIAIECESVSMQAKAACRRNIVLPTFDLGIDKLFDAPTG